MRFAYADPPYPGQAKRWYGNHPDYAGEVDHAELIARLERDYPDGWALSTSATALQQVLALCPAVNIAIWHVTNAEHPGGKTDRIWRSWEPVIFRGGRLDASVVRNLLACPNRSGFSGGSIPGQKPGIFSRWVFTLLGAEPGDEMDDLFPGSGAVAAEWDAYCRQPWLSELRVPSRNHVDRRRLVRAGDSPLFEESRPNG